MKKTKIVCTIGPASESVDMLVNLINAGMNVCRLNFSHGDYEEHGARIKNIREAVKITGKRVAILLDTKGPEIRTNDMENGAITMKIGDSVRISMTEVLGTNEKFSITYPELINDVNVGSHILLDDGLIDLEVTDIDRDANEIVTVVKNEGVLKNKKGVNVPGVSVNLPGITEKDANDIRFGIGQGIDFIAASFVRRASDVLEITKILEEENATHIQIIPKIENQEGIDNIDEILKVSDGLMVARGDMGVEIPTEDVPVVQKALIKKCNALGKPVITATQMLDSMQRNPRPTRAEANDVANAIYDGTDAVMLSGETAAGDYPLEAVQTMVRIAVRTEETLVNQDSFALKLYSKTDMTEAIGQSVGHTARNLGIQTIVAATESGHTARMISKYRPKAHIVAITFSEQKARSLSLSWGVYATVADKPSSTDEMFNLASKVSQEEGYASEGDLIIITAGVPVGEKGTTNLMKIQMIGSKLVQGQGVGEEAIIAKAVVAGTAEEAVAKATEGAILVTKTTDKEYMPAIEKASALVVEEGGLTSHAAVVAIAQNIPVIVGAADATSLINNDEVITVDPRRGIVYRGATTAI
ncbi:pyruvate kinase [Enterococcus faecalis]|uniref:pyruvate kinase n=1 Tax=Enterococcus faecalis TaxID=1351 RepID=UPI0011581452|nr:pyruvate kinase [Enterococcus faecalis]HAP5017330.1 pyruvate kinase [Enterococcus faecalis EX166083VC26]HAP5020801.1 pyruvate kinase [Enterococcus faecalis EX166083VC23]HAP5022365.1 pyruvate kinase [Enterococcus faecalis EX166083VC20]HAP5025365.1 pyruvate kinase [Enterococcus faecalis EX166083VC21]HAP5028749.1 pyruvate kinase [Enterococcus faecalis EX166083VC18]HAP5031553.1 pyruvate kinase [Enterococcus faecalis EX166083VC17]HAP5034105.1 pyruvate kinase [Enterococcus faecalis EX166083VC19